MQTIPIANLPNFTEDFLPKFPKQIYYRGNLEAPSKPLITVVGTRKPSSYGLQLCDALMNELAPYDITLISGLAYGVDSEIHKRALEKNITTIAVPGSGISDESIYPRNHLGLAHKILENNGLLLSAFEPTTKAAPYMFPVRNQLMAAMSTCVIVIECTEKSGTSITAHTALEFGKPLYVFPGSYFSPLSQGNHALLTEGAQIISSIRNLVEDLNLQSKIGLQELEGSQGHGNIIAYCKSPRLLQDICLTFNLETSQALIQLGELELFGFISKQIDGTYIALA